jgi:hypothetical protein
MPGTRPGEESAGNGPSTAVGRVDRAISVPLLRLFYPDPDPTESYPHETAEVEGYVVAPDQSVTIAATATSPGAVDMLDSVWASLRRRGVGRRHMLLLDDRGRTVSVMTFRVGPPDERLRFLRSTLVVPVRAHGGFAEVHLLASPDEADALVESLAKDGSSVPELSDSTLPPARETRSMQPEDWAFLGLLASVGAFDGPEGPTPELVAELIGTDPEAFAVQARAVERSLQDVVTGLFAPTAPGPGSGGLRS